MLFNVDFVFPYVNPADNTWQKQFSYCKGTNFTVADVRYRDFSLLKYIFRSIEKYANWINRVVVLVAYRSQIPSFLKESGRLVFVEHKDFIPADYLPTFNSNTIEMFLPKVKILSEHFLYSNDDLIFVNNTVREDFFLDKRRIAQAYTFRKKADPKNFQASVKRTWDLVESFYGKKPNFGCEYEFLKQHHGCAAPRLLSDCKDCYNYLEKDILKSLTMFRELDRNINQYLYGYYSLFEGHVDLAPYKLLGNYVSGEDESKKIVDAINNSPSKMLCINDTAAMTQEKIDLIYQELDKKFPDKSSFES